MNIESAKLKDVVGGSIRSHWLGLCSHQTLAA